LKLEWVLTTANAAETSLTCLPKHGGALFLPWMYDIHGKKSSKGLTAIPPEIDCDHTAMGLPPVTSAVFLIAKIFG
jgi:hypothetical protein